MKKLSDFMGKAIPHKMRSGSSSAITLNRRSNLARTRLSNTGYDSQPRFECGVDWLDFTLRNVGGESEAEEIIKEVEALTGDSIDYSFSKAVFNGRMWQGSGNGVLGVRLWYDGGAAATPASDALPQQLKFSFSGKVMSGLHLPILADWLSWRAGLNQLDCTRIDICVDDKDRCVSLGQITQSMIVDNFFNAKYKGLDLSGSRGQDIGVTVYFGHPSSHKRLRIYDKDAESKGKVTGIRWEAQFRKAVAHDVLFTILEKIDDDVEKATDYFKSVVTGVIDFRDRSGADPNRARCPRLPWFEYFCNALAACPIRLVAEKREPLIQRSIDWINKSVAQSLSVVKKVLGDDWPAFIETTINAGGEKLNNRKRQLISITAKDSLWYETS